MMNSRLFLRSALGVGLLLAAFSVAPSAGAVGDGGITGKVLRQSGAPLRSVWVVMRQGGSERGRSLTGDDGRYYIGNLGAGSYEIVVEQQQRETYKAQINLPGNQRYDIVIR